MATTHTVEDGETIVSIAHDHGFRDWKVIYEHADNAALRERRPDPDVLAPGDVVVIPDKVPQVFECLTGKRHQFKLKTLMASIRVVLADEHGVPHAGKRYTLQVGATTYEGTTAHDGLVSKDVAPDADEARLTLWPDDEDPERKLEWTLRLGHLDPPEQPRGAKARLSNLGYGCDPTSVDLADDATVAALRAFQQDAGVPVTGQLTPETIDKLRAMHGS